MERVEIRPPRRAPRRVVATVAALVGLWQLGSLTAAALPPDPVPVPTETQRVGELTPTVTSPPLVIGGSLESATGAAVAGSPAKRLRQMGGIPFPMDPRPTCTILSNFGDPRSGGRSHQAIDILATLGQRVYAVADGTLTIQDIDGPNSPLAGNAWTLLLPDKTIFFYAHLSAFAPGLVVGSTVHRGDVIGYVGDTGNPGTGNYHLHFGYQPQGGSAVNPIPFLEIPTTCTLY